jgi:hypothetical protein
MSPARLFGGYRPRRLDVDPNVEVEKGLFSLKPT